MVRLQELVRRRKFYPANLKKYEDAGLLQPRRNGERSWRSYTDADVRRLAFIATATEMGFEISDIRTFFETDPPSIPRDRIKEMVRRYTAKKTALASRLERLRSYRGE